eukprot:TRINITY_DN1521_c0_g2_i1.p1 TRINITY_DN1521_c0_g2~~TRINITY_DN1521_c0_g2_i1.p1  ORF type:complete len:455 (-),score=96.83 TRINITY_DN1521_c0_g2_i1:187-1380(-)
MYLDRKYPEKALLDLLLSGVVAGFACLAATASIEKFGGVVGGVIATIPSTLVVTAIALSIIQESTILDLTMSSVSVGLAPGFFVLLIWRVLPPLLSRSLTSKQRLVITLGLSFTTWIGLAYGLVVLLEELLIGSMSLLEVEMSTIGIVALLIYLTVSLIAAFVPTLPVGRKGDNVVPKKEYLFRFLTGFVASNFSLLLSYFHLYASGVALAFPATALTALVSLWLRQGETVAMSAATPMLVGSASSGIFSLVFAYIHPILLKEFSDFAIIFSIAAPWFLVVYCFSLPLAVLLRKKEIAAYKHIGKIKLDDASASTDSTPSFTRPDLSKSFASFKNLSQGLDMSMSRSGLIPFDPDDPFGDEFGLSDSDNMETDDGGLTSGNDMYMPGSLPKSSFAFS